MLKRKLIAISFVDDIISAMDAEKGLQMPIENGQGKLV